MHRPGDGEGEPQVPAPLASKPDPMAWGRVVRSASALALALASFGFVHAAGPARGGTVVPCQDDRSWVAGSVEICDGVLVYRDYVYDDYGADTGVPGAKQYEALSASAGDARYPAGQENTADLLKLELWIDGGALRVRALLNTLYESSATEITVVVDGVSHVLGGGDASTNTIEGSIPAPAGESFTVRATTAMAGGPPMNVAFRGVDETGVWWEDRQAAALKAGDVSSFAYTVDVADLRPGVTRGQVFGPGLYERVYRSAYTVGPGEGVSYDGIPGRIQEGGSSTRQAFHFFGPHQPYGVYVPPGDGPHGLQLLLHGRSANHSSLVSSPGMQAQIGDALDRVILTPLGRGPLGMYSDSSLRDVLDAWADVEAHLPIDSDKVFGGGYSMGGYGTLRLVSLYPDRFAGYIDWVGPSGDAFNGTPVAGRFPPNDGYVGNPLEMLDNLRSVPGALLYAGEDELVHVNNGYALAARYQELGYEHVFWFHPVAEHLTFALLDRWEKEAQWTRGRTRVRRPARVTYRVDPVIGNRELDLVHDRAYWVSDITARAAGELKVDAISYGCGGTEPVVTADPPGAGPLPVPWVSQSASTTGERDIEQANRIDIAVANVASLSIDASEACIDPATVDLRKPDDLAVTFVP